MSTHTALLLLLLFIIFPLVMYVHIFASLDFQYLLYHYIGDQFIEPCCGLILW